MRPYILVASERGTTAAMMRSMRPVMWVARLALSAASASPTHCLVVIGLTNAGAEVARPLAASMGVSVAPGKRTVTWTP
jgi:hypothetical protein